MLVVCQSFVCLSCASCMRKSCYLIVPYMPSVVCFTQIVYSFHFFRKGDQLLQVNDHNLSTATIEEAYQILNTLPHGKVTLKIHKNDSQGAEELPTNVNHALDKLTNERSLLDKKLAKKPLGVGVNTVDNNRLSQHESFGK